MIQSGRVNAARAKLLSADSIVEPIEMSMYKDKIISYLTKSALLRHHGFLGNFGDNHAQTF